jgi:peptide deformylase
VAYFNPEIIQSSQNLIDLPERCLSFPEEECIIKRPETVDIKYQDYAGNWSEDQLTGIWSRCFQHELDHLNGVVMQQRYKEQYAE